MVTENGAAFPDVVGADGRIADVDRTDYLRTHPLAMHRAITEGAPVVGYYVWSLLDNFEWVRLFWSEVITLPRRDLGSGSGGFGGVPG